MPARPDDRGTARVRPPGGRRDRRPDRPARPGRPAVRRRGAPAARRSPEQRVPRPDQGDPPSAIPRRGLADLSPGGEEAAVDPDVGHPAKDRGGRPILATTRGPARRRAGGAPGGLVPGPERHAADGASEEDGRRSSRAARRAAAMVWWVSPASLGQPSGAGLPGG